jgi:hypothetical protein
MFTQNQMFEELRLKKIFALSFKEICFDENLTECVKDFLKRSCCGSLVSIIFEDIKFVDNKLFDEIIESLKNRNYSHQIQHLYIKNVHTSQKNIETIADYISTIKSLDTFRLVNVHAQNFDCIALALTQNQALTCLEMSFNIFEETNCPRFLKALQGLNNLKLLDLKFCKFPEEDAKKLQKWCEIKSEKNSDCKFKYSPYTQTRKLVSRIIKKQPKYLDKLSKLQEETESDESDKAAIGSTNADFDDVEIFEQNLDPMDYLNYKVDQDDQSFDSNQRNEEPDYSQYEAETEDTHSSKYEVSADNTMILDQKEVDDEDNRTKLENKELDIVTYYEVDDSGCEENDQSFETCSETNDNHEENLKYEVADRDFTDTGLNDQEVNHQTNFGILQYDAEDEYEEKNEYCDKLHKSMSKEIVLNDESFNKKGFNYEDDGTDSGCCTIPNSISVEQLNIVDLFVRNYTNEYRYITKEDLIEYFKVL